MKKLFSIMFSLVLIASMLVSPAAAVDVEPTILDGVKYSVSYMDVSKGDANLANILADGVGRIDHILILDEDFGATSLSSLHEIPANTAVFFDREEMSAIDMYVDYIPKELSLYYGIANTQNYNTATRWEKEATNGSGHSVIRPNRTGRYYPFVANPYETVIYADVFFATLHDVRQGGE